MGYRYTIVEPSPFFRKDSGTAVVREKRDPQDTNDDPILRFVRFPNILKGGSLYVCETERLDHREVMDVLATLSLEESAWVREKVDEVERYNAELVR